MSMRSIIIQWDNEHPLDREYRKKHNIAFNSPQHRELCQLDIYMEWLEDQLYNDAMVQAKHEIECEAQLKKGIWLRERTVTDEASNELFDQIDISDIPSTAPIQIKD